MNYKKTELDLLNDFLIEEILEASDNEIMEESSKLYENSATVASHVRLLISDVIDTHNKNRLTRAKNTLQAHREKQHKATIDSFSLDQKKEILQKISNNNKTNKLITLAARNENELSNNDLQVLLQSALDLGLIDEEGHIL